MTEKNITFEDLPKAMTWMMDKLNELTSKVDSINNQTVQPQTDQWMNLKELCVSSKPPCRTNCLWLDKLPPDTSSQTRQTHHVSQIGDRHMAA